MSSQQPKRKGRPPTRNAKAEHSDWYTNKKPLEKDPCDCPHINCPGCWYPCETCGSLKCSPFCRTLRKETQQIEWRKSD